MFVQSICYWLIHWIYTKFQSSFAKKRYNKIGEAISHLYFLFVQTIQPSHQGWWRRWTRFLALTIHHFFNGKFYNTNLFVLFHTICKYVLFCASEFNSLYFFELIWTGSLRDQVAIQHNFANDLDMPYGICKSDYFNVIFGNIRKIGISWRKPSQ